MCLCCFFCETNPLFLLNIMIMMQICLKFGLISTILDFRKRFESRNVLPVSIVYGSMLTLVTNPGR